MAENKATITQPASLSGTLVRKGGQIYADPTTPAGGKQVGDSPDQAKMRGTAAQKAPVVREATKPIVSTTVSPQGLAQEEVTAAGQQQETAQALQQLGSYADRVRQIAATKVSKVTGEAGLKAADADILTDAFGKNAVVGEAQVPIAEYLEKYAADIQDKSLTPEQQQQVLVELSTALQQEGMAVTPGQLAQWYDRDIAGTIGAAAGAGIGDTLTFAEFKDTDWQSLGFKNAADVASILGFEDLLDDQGNIAKTAEQQLAEIPIDQLDELIETKRQEEFSQIEELQRQLASAPPGSQVAQQIKQRLADLSGAGVAATERQVEELVETLATDVTVEIGGQEYAIEDMLSDENISNFVEDYLALPLEEREGFFPKNYKKFKDWVDANEQALQAVVDTQYQTAQEFEDVQYEIEVFKSQYNIHDDLLEKMGVSPQAIETLTGQGWLDFQKQFEASNAGQILTGTAQIPSLDEEGNTVYTPVDLKLTEADKQNIASAMSDNYDVVKDWDAPKLVERYKMARELDQNPEATLGQLAEGLISGDFITDNNIEDFQNLKIASTVIDEFPATDRQTILGDADVKELIQKRMLSPDMLQELPQRLAQYEAYEEKVDDFSDLAANHSAALDDEYQTAQMWAQTGDPQAKEVLQKYRSLDRQRDGVIDEADLAFYDQKLQGLVSKKEILQNTAKLPTEFFQNKHRGQRPEGMYQDMVSLLKIDGNIDRRDAEDLLTTHGDKASQFLSQFPDVPTTTQEMEEYKQQQAEEERRQAEHEEALLRSQIAAEVSRRLPPEQEEPIEYRDAMEGITPAGQLAVEVPDQPVTPEGQEWLDNRPETAAYAPSDFDELPMPGGLQLPANTQPMSADAKGFLNNRPGSSRSTRNNELDFNDYAQGASEVFNPLGGLGRLFQ